MKKAEDFLGLTKKRAQDRAESYGFIFRLIRKDNVSFFDYPSVSGEPIRTDRVCVEIENGQVVESKIE